MVVLYADLKPADKPRTKYSDLHSENKALFIQNRTEIGSLGINYGLRYYY